MISDFFVLLLYQANEIVLAICHPRRIAKFRGSYITNTKYYNYNSSLTLLFYSALFKVTLVPKSISSGCWKNKIINHLHKSNKSGYVFFRYTLAGKLQRWLEYFCKLTVAFRYTLPRILQKWLEHFCKLTVRRFQYTLSSQDTIELIRVLLQVDCRFQVYTTQDTTALVRVFLQVKGVFRHTAGLINVFLQVNCSFSILYQFTLSHAAQQTITSLERLALSYFAFVFWSPSYESAFNYFWREICTARVCLAPRSVSSVIKIKEETPDR